MMGLIPDSIIGLVQYYIYKVQEKLNMVMLDPLRRQVGESGRSNNKTSFSGLFSLTPRWGMVILFLFLSILWSCERSKEVGDKIPESGVWRGILQMQGQELPFNFQVNHQGSILEIVLMNGDERLRIDEVEVFKDSIRFPMHIFDTQIMATFSRHSMEGHWQKNYLDDYIIPFSARYGESFRFTDHPQDPPYDINGRWEVYFLSGSDSTLAVGVFRLEDQKLEGTFLVSSGDYRYLDGEMVGDSLKLSTFDGEHAYLFKAKMVSRDTLKGTYWSGKTWSQPWVGIRNPSISLPDPESLTFLKPGYDRIEFQLPDLDGRMVSLDDPTFTDKVLIIQIFGTWCPNCMDETLFLSSWYNKNRARDAEIVALAFERKDDINYARERITRMKEKFNINYDFLFGGRSDKSVAASVLPMLNTVVSFPTMIIIDKRGKVRKIHTGFSGPGTGVHYEKFAEEFYLFMDKLLDE
jgi:thiol-disulfide isomerase/thioredoxin